MRTTIKMATMIVTIIMTMTSLTNRENRQAMTITVTWETTKYNDSTKTIIYNIYRGRGGHYLPLGRRRRQRSMARGNI